MYGGPYPEGRYLVVMFELVPRTTILTPYCRLEEGILVSHEVVCRFHLWRDGS